MKILTALIVLQTIAVIALLFKFASFETEMSSTAPDSALTRKVVAEAVVDRTATYGDEEQLRKIIREELASILQSSRESRPLPEPEIASEAQESKRQDETDHQYQRELVQGQLDSYASQGSISEIEMADLQMEIAKLDKSGRKMMLREMTKMLNSGELKGHL